MRVFTGGFGKKKKMTNFDYYKHDQIRNLMACCAIFFFRKYMNVHHIHMLLYDQDE